MVSLQEIQAIRLRCEALDEHIPVSYTHLEIFGRIEQNIELQILRLPILLEGDETLT